MSLVTSGMLRAADEAEKIAYKHGAEDLREAILTLYNAVSDAMSPGDMRDLFDTIYIQNVLENNTSIDIITKVKNWKKEKQEEVKFEIGDEIECVDPLNMQYGKKCVVLRIREEMKLLDLSDLSVYYSTNFSNYRKTGKRYRPDPIPFEKICTEGENK